MSNFDTIKAITDNLQSTLQARGIMFSRATFGGAARVPATLLPHGQIFYGGESFEYTHGQRPGYAQAAFTILVVLSQRDPTDLMRTQQNWVHLIREALTVDALNVDELAATRYVSRVTTAGVDIEEMAGHRAVLNYRVTVRYREQ